MRASQFIVFAILPFYLNTIFQLEKGYSFNHSDLPILEEKLETSSINDSYKDVEIGIIVDLDGIGWIFSRN